ncbi:peptide methionine sulfoxide reductase [Sphaerosporella brunnea]|uniref:peptide-methionine (S)-S-oxide reductase n=1 Tax=Sphaerosporella brunnea TaxID=1250544 RepID=A0A5J5F5Y9_9PEZI|nr:peptide methionine sulfoxide reductase [Sphaerosporella brunnea]
MVAGLLNRLIRTFSTSTTTTSIGSGMSLPAKTEKATLAAGCFWGVEHLFRKKFDGKGLIDARVGYCGGDADHPNYRQVCAGTTGHAESVQLLYDPEKIGYDQILDFFYRMHDPTTADRQGPDVGTQYRSAIFTHGPEQEAKAKSITEAVQKQWWKSPITTKIIPVGQWWDAEEYHQLYLTKNPDGYECPAHFVRDFPPLETESKI